MIQMSAIASSFNGLEFAAWQELKGRLEARVSSRYRQCLVLPATRTIMETSAQTEAEDPSIGWMARIAEGDEEALGQLVDRWKRPLINYFYRSLGDFEQAEDLAQITFVRIYHSAGKYQPQAKFSTYLFHIARRLLINEYRKRERRPFVPVDPREMEAPEPGGSSRRLYEIEEAFGIAVEGLPEKHRTAILLLKQQQLSYEEIADVMDASTGAVKTWVHRARQQLREALSDFAG